MRTLGLLPELMRGGSILCIGAHSDDIEIGCGGTLRKLLSNSPNVEVSWVVLSATGIREDEAQASAEYFLGEIARKKISLMKFRNGYFPYVGADIKDYFESLKKEVSPSLILTHYRQDLHQDHRVVSELTWNTFRDHLILEYEIPKYDGDLGNPNVFSLLLESQVDEKARALNRFFRTQNDKQWFSESTFKGLCRIRGVECNSPTGFAEAFYGRKVVLD